MSRIDEIRERQDSRFSVDHLTKIKSWHGDPVIGTLVSNLCKAYENDGKDIMDLLSEVERLEKEKADGGRKSFCVYCGHTEEGKSAEEVADQIVNHMAICEKHPMKLLWIAENENEALRTENERLREALDFYDRHGEMLAKNRTKTERLDRACSIDVLTEDAGKRARDALRRE